MNAWWLTVNREAWEAGRCCALATEKGVLCGYCSSTLQAKPVKKEKSRAELNAEDRAKWEVMVKEVQEQEAARFASRQPITGESESCASGGSVGGAGTATTRSSQQSEGTPASIAVSSTAPMPKARRPRSPKQLAADEAFRNRKAQERKQVAQQEAVWANAGTDFEAAPAALTDDPDPFEW